MESAVPEGTRPRLEAYKRDGSTTKGTLVAQTATGKVRIEWDGGRTELTDLESLEYRWLPEGRRGG